MQPPHPYANPTNPGANPNVAGGYPPPPHLYGQSPTPKRGLGVGGWLAVVFAVLALFMTLALVASLVKLVKQKKEIAGLTQELEEQRALVPTGAVGEGDEGDDTSGSRLPRITRHVPNHPVALVDGCSEADLTLVDDALDSAIQIGAPLYNGGNFAGCYHTYAGTALDVEGRLPKSCRGPAEALAAGRRTAAALDHPALQAWAMRDAFDGLIDVIQRHRSSGAGGGTNL